MLNQYCVSCHGGVRQKSGVSFIYREQALGKGDSGHPTIVPGDPDASAPIARLKTDDDEERMPYKATPLNEAQINVLETWIAQGAEWEPHWAFVRPQRERIAQADVNAEDDWMRNPIDSFVLARLEDAGLSPSPPAAKAELLRRASLDLTGIAPSVEELEAFLSDAAPDAYERHRPLSRVSAVRRTLGKRVARRGAVCGQ
ncbi:MAG: DUF1549 domain-containing protein [Pseudomonadota bacterium]